MKHLMLTLAIVAFSGVSFAGNHGEKMKDAATQVQDVEPSADVQKKAQDMVEEQGEARSDLSKKTAKRAQQKVKAVKGNMKKKAVEAL